MLPLKIKSTVIKGKGRGKGLGIPTINFEIPQSLEIPYGVYAGRLVTKDKIYPVAIHFGPRPVFSEKDISLEAYVLEKFESVIKEGEVVFIKYIREIKEFTTEEMIIQINQDIKEILKVLNSKL